MFRSIAVVAFATVAAGAPSFVVFAQEPSPFVGTYTGAIRATSFSGGKDASRMSGSVTITPSQTRRDLFKVEIRLSTMGSSPTASATGVLQWSISPGRCGARVQFLVPPAETTPLEIHSGGDAEVIWEGRLALAGEANYQLMLYDRGFREQDIVGCANLRYNRPKP
ncbi:MAG: hypothetical protein FJ363_10025 [Gemmatimonadetes bacterium]|nr:hypothetical protein [Gemmatimonadota bacterium]